MSTKKHTLLLFSATLVVVLAFISPVLFPGHKGSDMPAVIISGEGGKSSTIYVEVADTQPERSTGLMNRDSLENDRGMLFVFKDEDLHTFWMANTRISLDMIFISSDMRVVDIHHDAIPMDRTIITPETDSLYVLEVNGGYCRENGISIGDRVKLKI